MCRKSVLFVLVAVLLGFVGSAFAVAPHQIDDFESYKDSPDLQSKEAWEQIYRYSDDNASPPITRSLITENGNKKMELTFEVSVASDVQVVGLSSVVWNWTGRENGIRLWIKGDTSISSATTYLQVRFHEGNGGDTWRSGLISFSAFNQIGGYVELDFANFEDYGGFGGSKDNNGKIDFDEIKAFYVAVNYSNQTTGNIITLWVDDITAIPDPPDLAIASAPSPSKIAACVSQSSPTLSWLPGDNADSHDVYFGINSTPGGAEFKGNQAGSTFNPGSLESNETYYWRVDEVNGNNTWTGDIWSFTTCDFNEITFFFASDTHANRGWFVSKQNRKLVQDMNALPDTNYPVPLGTTQVARPRGLLIAGDVTAGDQENPDVLGVASEWYSFINYYGGNGEGWVNFPVFEGYGNHDFSTDNSVVIDGIASRNNQRDANLFVLGDGLNYSWDWDSVHFVNMNIWPGYDLYDADGDGLLYNITFLEKDLADSVGTSGRPVVIFFHYPLGVETDGFTLERQSEFANVINKLVDNERIYNVIGIFHGHRHWPNTYYQWNGRDVFEHAAAAIGGERFMVVRISGTAKTMHVFTRTNGAWDSLLLEKSITFGNSTFRILDTNSYYPTLQDAYDAASDGYTIQSQAVVSTENLTLDQNKSITLKSGYDSSFTTFTGETTILGNVDITDGSITIDEGNLTITN